MSEKIKIYYNSVDDELVIVKPNGEIEYRDTSDRWVTDDDFYLFSSDEFIGEL